MKSPFPGMDPYVESGWGDFHTSLITYMRDMIRPQLPSDLRVRAQESIRVQEEGQPPQTYYPDVRVIEGSPRERSAGTAILESVGVAEPMVLPVDVTEPPTQRSLRIIDTRSGKRVVTAIEVLSHFNKQGSVGTSAYREKQQDLIDAGVNLVEVDLLHGGEWVLAVREVPKNLATPYRVCVIRARDPSYALFYAIDMRQPLPKFRVPLRTGDNDAIVDLQALFEQAYENGGGDDIDYREDPSPPLSPADAAWAHRLLQEKGLR